MGPSKALLIIFALILICVAGYLFEARRLSAISAEIFGSQCTDVNPKLIEYKNNFISFKDAIKNPDKYPKDFHAYYSDYIEGVNKYIAAENTWINKEKAFMASGQYKYFMPAYIKQGDGYTLDYYQNSVKAAQTLIDMYNGSNISDQQKTDMQNAVSAREADKNMLSSYFKDSSPISLFIRNVINVAPPSACTPENTDIPDTSSLSEEGPF